VFYPDNHTLEHHMLRLVNEIATGGIEYNHLQRIVGEVPDPEPDPWYEAWSRLAAEEENSGEAELKKGHKDSAREFFFRAANYYRESVFYLSHDRPERVEAFTKSRDVFRRASELLDNPLKPVEIPWKDKSLPGYVGFPNRPGPYAAVAFIGGADATKEELYFMGGRRLLDRGFVVMMMDGPGQGELKHLRQVYATPDWDTLGWPIYETLSQQPDVDPDRTGVLGISMGGYHAPMVVSSGAPFRCLAVWGACFDVLEDLYLYYPPIQGQLQGISDRNDEQAREFFARFNLKEAAGKIECPVLITHGTADVVVSTQAAKKFDAALQAEHEMHLFEGSVHCMYDVPTKALPLLFDWFEDHLRREGKRPL
jgi:dipeptidyl aminopeptidase/acylaminoacyl peptidase